MANAVQWIEDQKLRGLKVEIVRLAGRTPVIFFEAPATRSGEYRNDRAVWDISTSSRNSTAGAATWDRGRRSTKRAGSTAAAARMDGYATYSSITAIAALDAQGVERPRCVGIIETCEESGSYDLLPYLDALRDRMGKVGLVICLDSGAGNYEQLWLTTSLRGTGRGRPGSAGAGRRYPFGRLRRRRAIHVSYHAQAPGTARGLGHGDLLPKGFHCAIPAKRLSEAEATARILGDDVWKKLPWSCGQDGGPVLPVTTDPLAKPCSIRRGARRWP